ncbi:bifunctional tetrahydrofolate synthase/dihydrofolate synthase [Methylicorpusculum sp.]|uniref:bifunctional tetrahydrofolate synthase/dihydrofolate synthase n=1 Tax=Methylicorpusculum sp. TaxID=2713644 RepID=UPI0027274EEB|nr:bifunctional tetrahydrofolate synthase/dihydrofolate synthase [Methylicorpusculum sp.]MDO8846185.1 bifunctional tetrahydrofolate synthase/dihydrofolate synthase [Methylicorpusculum sp.]MDP2177911.1 bifunctional tetrahydrofolate synthase/dihydrofolate synthase [Methylicorpusculum sp.]MDP3528183.1 bifunctional tetrahydrofolate synthase/dihydrofolate synthase [Methylicorpusculum sp.]
MPFNSLKDWLQWQESLHPRVIDLGLQRVGQVFSALQPKYNKPVTLTIAGTNGKGSVVAFLESIYLAQGYKVGTYTSPHILKYNERIKINGSPVSDDLICSAFERIDAVRSDVSLSYFEFSTLAALDIFAQFDLDVQLLEVGLGGRLDAVNIIDTDLAIITSIGIDHTEWLGDTRESIGREKAGIFRRNVPAIVGDPVPPLSLRICAEETGAKVSYINQDFHFEKHPDGWNWIGEQVLISNLPSPNLKGEHQYRNAATVIAAITAMQNTLPVDHDALSKGISQVQLPGRFQYIEGKIPVLLDVAHNPQAVETLADFLKENFSHMRVRAVFSVMKDKDIAGIINIIKPLVFDWFCAPLINNVRSAPDFMLQETFSSCSVQLVHTGFADAKSAFLAVNQAAEEGDLVLIFGSFFLVSEYLASLE